MSLTQDAVLQHQKAGGFLTSADWGPENMQTRNPESFSRQRIRRLNVTLSMAVLAAGTASIFVQSAFTAWQTAEQGTSVKGRFVFIFRQGSAKLTEEEQKRRTEEVRAWALRRLQEGPGFDPRVLGEESFRLQEGTSRASGDGPVIALNFLQAADFNEAVNIAKTHPGLRYGVSIEVRPWTDPRAQAQSPQ